MKCNAITLAFVPFIRFVKYDPYHFLFCKLNVNMFKLLVCIICVFVFHERLFPEAMQIHSFFLPNKSRWHIVPVVKKGGAVIEGG
jgi:hypothetical protein